MPQNPLDYQLEQRPGGRQRSMWVAGVVATAIVVVNAILICAVIAVKDFRLLGGVLGVPILNASLLLVALGCVPLAKKYLRASVKVYVVVSIVTPITMFFLDIAILGWLVFPDGIAH